MKNIAICTVPCAQQALLIHITDIPYIDPRLKINMDVTSIDLGLEINMDIVYIDHRIRDQ